MTYFPLTGVSLARTTLFYCYNINSFKLYQYSLPKTLNNICYKFKVLSNFSKETIETTIFGVGLSL